VKDIIRDVTESNLNDVPEPCKSCLYWSFPEEFDWTKRKVSEWKQKYERKKKQWITQTLSEFGSCGKILYHNNAPAGYAEYGPSNRFLQIKEYKSHPVGKIEDGIVFLSCLYIADKNLRGKGLGERLLDSIIADLKTRGFKAVETFALRSSSNNPSGPVELYLKKGFHIKDETNPVFPLVRLDFS